jgi:hypothetical protein
MLTTNVPKAVSCCFYTSEKSFYHIIYKMVCFSQKNKHSCKEAVFFNEIIKASVDAGPYCTKR